VTGTLQGTVSQKVGDYDYAYPRVEADVVYLWPKRSVYAGYPYDPYWGPWGPSYYGPWAGPFWGDGYWGGGYWGGRRR